VTQRRCIGQSPASLVWRPTFEEVAALLRRAVRIKLVGQLAFDG
jgi:hypothetical protein